MRSFGWSPHDGISALRAFSISLSSRCASPTALCPRGHSEQAAVCKPGRNLSPNSGSIRVLLLDFPPPELGEVGACWEAPAD